MTFQITVVLSWIQINCKLIIYGVHSHHSVIGSDSRFQKCRFNGPVMIQKKKGPTFKILGPIQIFKPFALEQNSELLKYADIGNKCFPKFGWPVCQPAKLLKFPLGFRYGKFSGWFQRWMSNLLIVIQVKTWDVNGLLPSHHLLILNWISPLKSYGPHTSIWNLVEIPAVSKPGRLANQIWENL